MLAPNVKQVIAVDSSAAMLKAAKKRTIDLKNVDLRRGALEALPIEDAGCDAALLLLVLTYADDPTKVLSEMSRIVKPGGRAVVMDLLPHDRDDFRRQMGQRAMGFTPDEMKELMAACGLADATVRALPPQPNVKGPALFLATTSKR
jgi:ArsR family transcriptional regulator